MATVPIPTKRDLKEFWKRVDKTPGHGPWGNCWIWTRKGTEGYGNFHYQRTLIKPSRFSYMLAYGPTDLWVLHRCDIRPCVNPAHLFAGTRKDNMVDCAKKERVSTTKLTGIQVAEIRKLLREGKMTCKVIGELFGVTKSNIQKIGQGKYWKHIK